MRLDLYFARRFLSTFGGLLAIFTVIYALLDMVEQIRKFDTDSVGFVEILRLTLLNMPSGLYSILPLVVILSAISLFISMARSSELVISRAAGRSALRSLLSPVLMAFLLGLISVAVFNPIVAGTSKRYEVVANQYKKGSSSVLSISREGLWLRQADETGQTVIRAARANLDGTKLFAVTFLTFDATGLPSYRIEAETAELVPGQWHVTGVKRWTFGENLNPERSAETFDQLDVPSDLTSDQIRDSFGDPSSIPIWELPAFIDRLERAGFSARQHRVWFQMELALPVMFAAMVMVGAGFTMRHSRFGRTGMMVLAAVVLGFTIFFVRNFAQILGENGQIPIALAAWAPPIAAIFLTLGLLLHLEDG